jgi:hypothetical protein
VARFSDVAAFTSGGRPSRPFSSQPTVMACVTARQDGKLASWKTIGNCPLESSERTAWAQVGNLTPPSTAQLPKRRVKGGSVDARRGQDGACGAAPAAADDDPGDEFRRPRDLVERDFRAPAPNPLWVTE